jgi:hypothetical protein
MLPLAHPAAPPDLRPTALAGLRSRHDGSGSTQQDRLLHLGHRRRRPPRPLRARQVPRRHPADVRASPPRRRARADEEAGPRDQGDPRQGRHHRAARRAVQGLGSGVLQHLEVQPARPQVTREPAAAQGRLRGLPRRVLAERPGHPDQLRVQERARPPLQERRARHAHREVPRPRAST